MVSLTGRPLGRPRANPGQTPMIFGQTPARSVSRVAHVPHGITKSQFGNPTKRFLYNTRNAIVLAGARVASMSSLPAFCFLEFYETFTPCQSSFIVRPLRPRVRLCARPSAARKAVPLNFARMVHARARVQADRIPCDRGLRDSIMTAKTERSYDKAWLTWYTKTYKWPPK